MRVEAPHRSGDGEKAVVTDEDDVEDGRRAEQVVHEQPHLAETSAQHPATCQVVRNVDRDAEGTCAARGRTVSRSTEAQHHISSRCTFNSQTTVSKEQVLRCS